MREQIISKMKTLVDLKVHHYKTDFYVHDLTCFEDQPNVKKWFWSVGEFGTHLWKQSNRGNTMAINSSHYRNYDHYAIDFTDGTIEETSIDQMVASHSILS